MNNKILKYLAAITTVCISGFVILSVLVHILNPGLNALRFPLSLYRYASFGYLVIISLISIGTAELILGYILYNNRCKGCKGLSILLILMGISAIITGIIPMDIEPEYTVRGNIHNLAAGIQFFLFPVVVWIFRSSTSNQSLRTFTLFLAVTSIALLPFIIFTALSENSIIQPVYGLLQKIYILFIINLLYAITYTVYFHKN